MEKSKNTIGGLFDWLAPNAQRASMARLADWGIPNVDDSFLRSGVPRIVPDMFESALQEQSEPELDVRGLERMYRIGYIARPSSGLNATGAFGIGATRGSIYYLPLSRDGAIVEEHVRFTNTSIALFFEFLHRVGKAVFETSDTRDDLDMINAFQILRNSLVSLDPHALERKSYWGRWFSELMMEYGAPEVDRSTSRDASADDSETARIHRDQIPLF